MKNPIDTHVGKQIRATIAQIDAEPAAPGPQPTVKPLGWIECQDGTAHDPDCQYELETDGGFWRVTRGVTGGTSYVCNCSTIEEAKAAAQADYEHRILSALVEGEYVTHADTRALVAAAYEDAADFASDTADQGQADDGVIWGDMAQVVDAINSRTPDDAQAALERRDARIRNETLRELAAWAKSEGMLFTCGKILSRIKEEQGDDEST